MRILDPLEYSTQVLPGKESEPEHKIFVPISTHQVPAMLRPRISWLSSGMDWFFATTTPVDRISESIRSCIFRSQPLGRLQTCFRCNRLLTAIIETPLGFIRLFAILSIFKFSPRVVDSIRLQIVASKGLVRLKQRPPREKSTEKGWWQSMSSKPSCNCEEYLSNLQYWRNLNVTGAV